MGRFRRSRILCRELEDVFRDRTVRKIDAYACAMAVLFEDLRIEMAGLSEIEIKVMDVTGHRTNYFLRRSIATLKEFAHAITDLNRLPEFATVKERFDKETLRRWERAIRYFNRYGASLITPVRHGIGGHFRHTAAEHALEDEIKGSVSGSIEVTENELHIGGFHLHFARHIATAAMTEKVPGTDEFARKFRFMFRRTMHGYQHAIRATEAIVQFHLWGKFGG